MLQLWFFANSILWPFNIVIGELKLGVNVIVLTLVGAVWIVRNANISGYSAKVLFGVSIFFVFTYWVAIIGPCTDKYQKLLVTAPVLLILITIGLEVGWRAPKSDWLELHKVTTWIFLAAFSGFVIEALLPGFFPEQAGSRSEGKLSGLFSEPSHVAFSLFPSVAILLISGNERLRRKGFLALFGLILLSRSSTLIGLIVAWLLYRLLAKGKLSQGLFIALGLSAVVGLAAIVNYDKFVAPTQERIAGVIAMNEAKNLSSLVYVQGWEDAGANFLRTNGLGLGFNMMGCTPLPDVSARSTITQFNLALNAEDGSFLVSKIVSEMGVIGILFFVAIIWWWLRVEKNIRKYNSYAETSVISMQGALMFSFIASSLLRSTGYFSGGILLWVVATAGAVKLFNVRSLRLSNG